MRKTLIAAGAAVSFALGATSTYGQEQKPTIDNNAARELLQEGCPGCPPQVIDQLLKALPQGKAAREKGLKEGPTQKPKGHRPSVEEMEAMKDWI